MTMIVSILSQGTMGAGIARRLTENGVEVRTSLAGRSASSAKRAAEAGMIDASEAQLAEADFFLSIVPPGDALALVERMTPAISAANRKPVYVDCNAVNTETARRIDAAVGKTGAPFVDGGIIGGPPRPGDAGPRLYVAGPNAERVLRLRDFGLDVRMLSGPPDAASALKMSYAGITKGFTALGAAMMLAATRGGSAEALKAELAESQPALLGYLTRQVPAMYSKAYRWVAELDEISAFVGKDRTEHAMLSAAARLYERIAQDVEGERKEVGDLDKFVGK
jgi:putative dehydrogenase